MCSCSTLEVYWKTCHLRLPLH